MLHPGKRLVPSICNSLSQYVQRAVLRLWGCVANALKRPRSFMGRVSLVAQRARAHAPGSAPEPYLPTQTWALCDRTKCGSHDMSVCALSRLLICSGRA
eukprot:5732114-Pyramimonas_sp.AAC.1